jgi:hypothetical protein
MVDHHIDPKDQGGGVDRRRCLGLARTLLRRLSTAVARAALLFLFFLLFPFLFLLVIIPLIRLILTFFVLPILLIVPLLSTSSGRSSRGEGNPTTQVRTGSPSRIRRRSATAADS